MESELYEAALKGNVPSLLELLGKDKLLLDRIMTGNHTETPLHIAAMLGHSEFAKRVGQGRRPQARAVTPSLNMCVAPSLGACKGYGAIAWPIFGKGVADINQALPSHREGRQQLM
ncbi:hypothetical protein NL676_036052 [Syzygium grande]|nr:hypothetical protein NL676_036052 [Syzygium grande]